MVLPRVCKRWAHILDRPGAAWERTEIDLSALEMHSTYSGHLSFLDAGLVAAWFGR